MKLRFLNIFFHLGQRQRKTEIDATMDVGDATSTTSMDVVKVGLEKQVGLELEGIQG